MLWLAGPCKKNMIIKIQGGLGNQLFQYALGYRLSGQKGCELKVDIRDYKKRSNRFFALAEFQVDIKVATKEEIVKIIKFKKNNTIFKIYKLIESFKPLYKKNYISELSDNFDYEQIGNIKYSAYLDGYWQSYKYFEDISEQIKRIFTLNNPGNDYLELAKKIQSCNSVSVHIRRGDYVTNKQDVYYICGQDYYQKAINYINVRVDNPVYYIFSDDIGWVKDNLWFNGDVKYVSGKKLTDCEELILMSKCNHNIIANSTFSWWGAWLNTNKEKIVISPKKWFKDETRNKKDLIPGDWIQI